MELIDKAVVIAEIKNLIDRCNTKKLSCPANTQVEAICDNKIYAYKEILSLLDTTEVKDVNPEKESELIANGIMISVQSNKYGTNIYNTERNDFNHNHLQMAARKGIELGLKAVYKGE